MCGACSDAAVVDANNHDSESDAAIGYTGRLQLCDNASPILVWSAFFGAPSCSIGDHLLLQQFVEKLIAQIDTDPYDLQ